MKKTLFTLALLSSSVIAGNTANGQALYDVNCASCHNTGVGPSLSHIGNKSASNLKNSITNPSAEITAGYGNIMPSFSSLGAGSINDIVAYLKTQK